MEFYVLDFEKLMHFTLKTHTHKKKIRSNQAHVIVIYNESIECFVTSLQKQKTL